MAERELSILVRAKGAVEAARNIGKVNSAVGNLGRTAGQGVQTAVNNITRIGVVAAGVIATQVYAGIRSLEELERVTNATEGVIKSTGSAAGVTAKQVRDLAQSLEGITTADDKVIQSGENLLLTFTNIGKDVFPQATKAMVDLGIAMAQGDVENADFKSSAIQIGKALNDPIKGITALTRVGVSFTKEQKEQIKTLVESGKTMEAQKIILGELEREFGQAGAAAGKGFGADIRRVKDAVEDAQQALATGFLPLIRRVTDVLSRELAKPETIAAIQSFGESLAGGLDKLIAVASGLPWGSIGDAMKLAGQGAKAALDLFTSMPPWVQTAVLTGWGLNKLTGGALGSIVGQLGSGLVKGVLGMNAGVVNVRGAVVNTVGGGVGGIGATGGGGLLGKLVKGALGVTIVGLTAEAAFQLSGLNDPRHQLPPGQTNRFGGTTFRGTNVASEQLANLEAGAARARERIAGGERGKVEEQLADIEAEIAKLRGDVQTQTARSAGDRRVVPDLAFQSLADSLAQTFGAHETATGAFGAAQLQAFRGGDMSLLDERIRYLSGAQGSGAGSEQFLSLVGRDIAALKTALPNASAADAAKITAAIDLLGGILAAKKFEPTQALLDAVTRKPPEDSEAARAINAMATLPPTYVNVTVAVAAGSVTKKQVETRRAGNTSRLMAQ